MYTIYCFTDNKSKQGRGGRHKFGRAWQVCARPFEVTEFTLYVITNVEVHYEVDVKQSHP